MTYHSLSIPSETSDHVRALVRDRIDPQLQGFRAMLRSPVFDDDGNEISGGLSSAKLLLTVADGVAQELYIDKKQREGKKPIKATSHRFKEMFIEHFPWDQEPVSEGQIIGRNAASFLCEVYRDSLVHNLGAIKKPHYKGVFKVAQGPLDETEIEEIEKAKNRPENWTLPTLHHAPTHEGEKRVLTTKSLYWGVRCMFENVITARVEFDKKRGDAPTVISILNSISGTATSTYVLAPIHVVASSTSDE